MVTCDHSVGDRDFAGSIVSVDMYNLCIIHCSPENSAPSICLPIKILLAMIITPAHCKCGMVAHVHGWNVL